MAQKPKTDAVPDPDRTDREPTEEERRRAAERFVWKEGDVRVIKRGKRGDRKTEPER